MTVSGRSALRLNAAASLTLQRNCWSAQPIKPENLGLNLASHCPLGLRPVPPIEWAVSSFGAIMNSVT